MVERRMGDRRAVAECSYKEEHVKRMEAIEKSVSDIKERIYNGMGAELRKEINGELTDLRKDFKDENSGTRKLVVGILVTLVLSLVGIIVEGRFSSQKSTDENSRNYKAILQMEAKLEAHVDREDGGK